MSEVRKKSEPGTFVPMSALAAELARDPDGFRRRWNVPVLVRRRDPTPEPEEMPGGFHTLVGSRAIIDAALRQTRDEIPAGAAAQAVEASKRVPMADDVIRLEKRTGGAFADRIGLGRAPNVDVQILLARVSKYHAYVVVGEDGTVRIADAKSTFGTFVDGKELQPLEQVELADGATVRLASYEFRFHTPEGLVEALERHARMSTRPA